jgi:ACS family sodium-dependent inorganic phosphate cotransporter
MLVPERYKLVSMSFLAVFICYIDRVNISVAIIPMQEQFGWTESQVGLILGSFYFGYMFTMALGGLLADKYGGKIVLAYGVFFWSIFTILTPAFAYSGFWLLMFIRILMGLGEGITFPSWHALYARWIPFNERTRAIAITNSGISAGTVFGYLATALIIREYSWELVFYVFGMFGIVWVYFWHRSITSKPEDHPKILKSELDLIQKEAPAKSTADKIPLSKLICNGPFIAIVIATFCNNWALFTFLSYLPKFVNSPVSIGGLGIDLGSNLFIAIILLPSIVSVISLVAGGYIADMLIKRGVKTIIVRKTANSFGFYGAAFCLYLISFQESIFNIVVLLCLINLSSGIGAGGFGVNHADLGPKYTGSLVGISGGLGMIAAILSPIVAGLILESTNSWDLIFNICCGALVFGGTFYLFFASSDKQFN